MKVLLDACVAALARQDLESAGHDVVWAGEWSEDPGDETILARAHQEGRALVTLDKDFGELGVLRRMPHCGIIRLVNFRSSDQGQACLRLLAKYAERLQSGAILTAEPGRVRIRLPVR